MAFIKLKSNNPNVAMPTGNAIIKLSQSVFQNKASSEWAKFVVDPHAWLYKNNYRFVDKNYVEIGDGKVPKSLELMPVYDSATRMHIRVPFKDTLVDAQSIPLEDEPEYHGQFTAVLAHYFMRSCR